MAELKPCPFCGGSAFTSKEQYPNGETAWHVYHWNEQDCYLYNCILGDYDTEAEAEEAWNRRLGK